MDCCINIMPNSGGGYRAMVGSAGYLKAMKDTGVLDTVTYLAGKRKRGTGHHRLL